MPTQPIIQVSHVQLEQAVSRLLKTDPHPAKCSPDYRQYVESLLLHEIIEALDTMLTDPLGSGIAVNIERESVVRDRYAKYLSQVRHSKRTPIPARTRSI